jgi:hypothetical protein
VGGPENLDDPATALSLDCFNGRFHKQLDLGSHKLGQTLVFSSAAFNANVVSIGFILGYVTRKLPLKKIDQ